jgi:hypothetical protein
MPLYRVMFADQSGTRVQTHIRAPVAADHITLAVQKIWGPQCYWAWCPARTPRAASMSAGVRHRGRTTSPGRVSPPCSSRRRAGAHRRAEGLASVHLSRTEASMGEAGDRTLSRKLRDTTKSPAGGQRRGVAQRLGASAARGCRLSARIHACEPNHRDICGSKGLRLWATTYTLGRYIRLLLIIALVCVVVRLLQGRRPVSRRSPAARSDLDCRWQGRP